MLIINLISLNQCLKTTFRFTNDDIKLYNIKYQRVLEKLRI